MIYCIDCLNVVSVNAPSTFNSHLVLNMDTSRFSSCPLKPSPLFITYIRTLYVLFNKYFNDITHKNSICKTFNCI